ncbi:MAG: hypothetical protein ACR2QR_12550, partial [Woeseiaceae bacterium]
MELTTRLLKAAVLGLIFMQLSGCLDEDDEAAAEGASVVSANGLSLEFTNPAGADVIATPDIVVNIAGKAGSASGVDSVTWLNDRGGKGNANGKESWVTGNIVLQLGSNNITITAHDSSGNTVSKTLTVERENTAPSVVDSSITGPDPLFSYDSNLSNAAPVDGASIRPQPVYFFVRPGSEWTERGLTSILISCCRGMDGPGDGEGYSIRLTVAGAPWSEQFDLSSFASGGTRRVRVNPTFADGSEATSPVFDFTVADSDPTQNLAPLISGVPVTLATAGNQY